MNRFIKFKNKKIESLLSENKKLSEEINKIVAEWAKIDEYVKKLSMKMDRVKDKVRPLIADELKKITKLEEFDVVAGTKLEKNEVVVEIIDQVELYKDTLRKQKDEQQKTIDNLKSKTGVNQTSGEGNGAEKKD